MTQWHTFRSSSTITNLQQNLWERYKYYNKIQYGTQYFTWNDEFQAWRIEQWLELISVGRVGRIDKNVQIVDDVKSCRRRHDNILSRHIRIVDTNKLTRVLITVALADPRRRIIHRKRISKPGLYRERIARNCVNIKVATGRRRRFPSRRRFFIVWRYRTRRVSPAAALLSPD